MEFTYEELVSKIERFEQFSFARYGDGEWYSILGTNKQANCDGHHYFPDMGEALRASLEPAANYQKKHGNYFMGMQSLAMRVKGDEIKGYLKNLSLCDIDWCDSDILHKASIKGRIESFFEALKKRDVLLVAPDYLNDSRLKEKIGSFDHISVPEKDCWNSFQDIMGEIDKLLEFMEEDAQDLVILLCASMASEVMIHRIERNWNMYAPTVIDCGSLFDPYVGRNTRSYHKNLKLS